MKHIPLYATGLLGLAAGVFLAQVPIIKVQATIDLDGLVSLIVGLVLFLGVNLLYQQQSNRSHGEREIILTLTQDALAASDRLEETFRRWSGENLLPKVAVGEVTAGLQRYNNAVHTLQRSLSGCKHLKAKKIDLNRVQELREAYRVVLTQAPFPLAFYDGADRRVHAHQ